MTANRFVLPCLMFRSTVFSLCSTTLDDDNALKNLREVSVRVVVPDNSGSLGQLQNTMELNLRKVGLKINSDSTIELILGVLNMDTDLQQKQDK